jgi:hypothetical protein
MKKEFFAKFQSKTQSYVFPNQDWLIDQTLDWLQAKKNCISNLITYLENWKHIENQRTKDIAFACWEMLSLFAGGSFQNEAVQIEFHESEEDRKEFRLWWEKHYIIISEYYEEDNRVYSIMSDDENGFSYIKDENVYDFLFSVFA